MKKSILLLVCAITVTAHQANAQLELWKSRGNDIYNTNSRNVGIGTGTTIAPNQKLTVRSSNNSATTNIAGFYANNRTQGIGISYNALRSIGSNADVNMNFYTKGAGNFTFNTNNTEKIRINNVGDLEVGIDNVNNGTASGGALRFGMASGEAISSKRTGEGNSIGLDFYTAFENRMRITNGGDVEITGNNNGTPNLGLLRFGAGSGEAIASKRTEGENAWGLDFYTASQNRMRITNGGDVELLGNNNGAPNLGALRFGAASGEAIASKRTPGNNFGGLDFYTASQNRMRITNGGDVVINGLSPASGFKLTLYGSARATGIWLSSDFILKRDIADFTNAIDIIKQLKPRTYFFKTNEYSSMNLPERKQYGFVAQELEKVLPDVVHSSKEIVRVDAKGEGKMEEIKSVNYTELIPILTQAIREQQQQMEKQQQQINELKQVVATLSKGTSGQSSSINTNDESFKINIIATDATLEQNNPNPSSDGTSIRYRIPESSKNAQLIITDNLGRTVKQVLVSSGNGVVNIDASTLSRGIYNYSLWIDGKLIGSKKMVITH